MLNATLNLCVKFSFYLPANVKKLEIVGKKRCLEVLQMKVEIALLPRHAAPVGQWTSVLDLKKLKT